MTETFRQLKKKHTIVAIILSAIVGVFCALFAVGAVMLGIKLGAQRLAVYYYVLIGVGAFLISGGITFLFTRRTNKSLSKKIDSEYGLDEKVQTMIEFAGESGDIIQIQRADADEKLKNLPNPKLTFAKIWQYVLVAVIGLSMFLSGILVPSRYVAPEPPAGSDDYVLNEWDAKALDQLITDVEASDLEEGVKFTVVTALEVLKDKLPNVKTNKAMREAVTACADAVETAIMYANTYRDVAIVLNSYEKLTSLKVALIRASTSYQSDDVIINSLSSVKALQNTSEQKIRTALTAFTNTIAPLTGATKEEIYETVAEGFLDDLNMCMNPDENEELTDRVIESGLYSVLSEYSGNLNDVYDYQWLFADTLTETINTANASFLSLMSRELVPEVYNHMINDMIFNRLSEIFGVVLSHADWELPDISTGEEDSGDDSSGSGGIGDAESEYGSDAIVYDPNYTDDNKKFVPYGNIWGGEDGYATKLQNKITADGVSKEVAEYIRKYIAFLEGSGEDEDNN